MICNELTDFRRTLHPNHLISLICLHVEWHVQTKEQRIKYRTASLLIRLTTARKTWRTKMKLKIISYIHFSLGCLETHQQLSLGGWPVISARDHHFCRHAIQKKIWKICQLLWWSVNEKKIITMITVKYFTTFFY